MSDWKARAATLTDEDRGDGRSRHHAIRVPVQTTAIVVVQREGATYIAYLRRAGDCYPGPVFYGEGDTAEEAIRAALAAALMEARDDG